MGQVNQVENKINGPNRQKHLANYSTNAPATTDLCVLALRLSVDQPQPNHGDISQLMQRLINARCPPIRRICRCQLLIRRVPSFPPIDVKMDDKFGDNNRKYKCKRRANDNKDNQRTDGMDNGVKKTTEMKILVPTIKHDLGLQEVVRKHVLNLQQAQQEYQNPVALTQGVSFRICL